MIDNVNLNFSVVKSGFQKVGLTDCSDLPSFIQFISQFLNNRRVSIDLFTDTAHFVCIFERFSGLFFLKFSQNKIVMGKKILVPCLDVNNDRLFLV